MAKSNKPIVWGPFAAGGTITAFVTPVLIVLTLLAALGHVPDALSFAHVREYAAHWFGKVVIVAVISLSLWTSAHRLRITFYDLGVRRDQAVAIGCYAVATIGTIACLLAVLRI